MSESIITGNYGFATVYSDFTNGQTSTKNYRLTSIINDSLGNEIDRINEVVSANGGQTLQLRAHVPSLGNVIFKVFRQDFDSAGTLTEVKLLDKSFSVPYIPGGR